MTSPILAILGILLLIIVSIDIFTTIVHMDGGGLLSKPLTSFLWKIFFFLSGGKAKSAILNYAGGIILMYLLFSWVLILWLSYSLIYLSDADSVVVTSTGANASTVGNIYFVGYTLTSLGNGDLKSGSEFWRIVTNLMGINSMVFLSLGITYLVPVLKAVVSKRSMAIYIHKMGKTPQEIILSGWNGEDFSPLYQRFNTLETMIIQHSEHHLAYPVLHYFHSVSRKYSAPLNLAILDEALTIQEVYKIDKKENNFHWQTIRGAVDDYLAKVSGTLIKPADDHPSFPYAESVKHHAAQISEAEVIFTLGKLDERRRLLKSLVEKDGWQWNDVSEDSR